MPPPRPYYPSAERVLTKRAICSIICNEDLNCSAAHAERDFKRRNFYTMTYALFSFSVFLICALFIGIEINRSLRRGLSRTLISFATMIASVIVGIFLSRLISSLVSRWLITFLKENYFKSAYIGGSLNMETISLMLIQAVIGSLIFFFTFLFSRLFISLIVAAITNGRLAGKRDPRVRQDRTVESRRERLISVVAGTLSGIILAASLTSPIIGAFGVMQSAVVIIDETELNIWRAFRLDEAQIKEATNYSRNPTSVFLSVAGGKMIYTASATATIDGRLISIPMELRVLEREVGNVREIIELFGSEEQLGEEDVEVLDSICRLAEDSHIFKYFLAEYIQQGASTWLRNGRFMSVPYPNVTSQFRPLFDEVLRICSGTSSYTVSDDVRTMVNIYAATLTCGRDHLDVIDAITGSDVMTKISEEMKGNARMNNSVIRGELYRLLAYSMAVQMTRGGTSVENPASFYAFAKRVADTVNRVVADSKLTRDEGIAQIAKELGDIFDSIGMEFDDSAILLVSESLMDRFGRGADPATVEEVAIFFGGDAINVEDYENFTEIPIVRG